MTCGFECAIMITRLKIGGNRMKGIDTSIDGFKYVGINLTKQQFDDLCELNMFLSDEHRQNIPVFNIMLVLKTLGLLPEEMLCDTGNDNASSDTYEEIQQSLQRKYGKIKE